MLGDDGRQLRHGRAHALRAGHVLLGGSGDIRPGRGGAVLHQPARLGSEGTLGGRGGHVHDAAPISPRCRDPLPAQPEARAAGAPPHWTSYISVVDADATAARAGELGGAAVFREPFDVLDAGRVAAISDPTGAIVSLWQPRSRIGATLVNDVGALCWNELVTTDVERAKAYFGALLGWRYETDDSGYASIRNGGRPNGGIRAQTDQERGTPPNWLPYFTVQNADDAARDAQRGGGRTIAPTTDSLRGRTAVITDPQGAAFAVLEGETDP
jgi:uncharacterized protein